MNLMTDLKTLFCCLKCVIQATLHVRTVSLDQKERISASFNSSLETSSGLETSGHE